MANGAFDAEKFIKDMFGGLKNKGDGKPVKLPILPIIAVILLIWAITGTYTIKPDEEGVVLRFGKAHSKTTPGVHYHLPWPIERVLKPQVHPHYETGSAVFRTVYVGPPAKYQDIGQESKMVTGDENIVQLDFIIQYKIKNSFAYLFNIKDQHDTFKRCSRIRHAGNRWPKKYR